MSFIIFPPEKDIFIIEDRYSTIGDIMTRIVIDQKRLIEIMQPIRKKLEIQGDFNPEQARAISDAIGNAIGNVIIQGIYIED